VASFSCQLDVPVRVVARTTASRLPVPVPSRGHDNRVAILKMVTEAEHQLIDPNTALRLLTDREGELAFTHTTTTKYINLPVFGDLDRLASFLSKPSTLI
jgi:hypothetical protein